MVLFPEPLGPAKTRMRGILGLTEWISSSRIRLGSEVQSV
jgi:hypothetical protein